MTQPPPAGPGRCPLTRRARAALALTAALAAAAAAVLAWPAGPDRTARHSLYRLAGGPGPGLGSPPRAASSAVEKLPAGAFFQPPELTNTGPGTRHAD